MFYCQNCECLNCQTVKRTISNNRSAEEIMIANHFDFSKNGEKWLSATKIAFELEKSQERARMKSRSYAKALRGILSIKTKIKDGITLYFLPPVRP